MRTWPSGLRWHSAGTCCRRSRSPSTAAGTTQDCSPRPGSYPPARPPMSPAPPIHGEIRAPADRLGLNGDAVVRGLLTEVRPEEDAPAICTTAPDHSWPVPDGSTPVVVGSRAWHELLASASHVVDDEWRPVRQQQPAGQVVAQIGRGYPLGRIGLDAWRSEGVPLRRIQGWLEDVRRWDVVASPASWATLAIRAAFEHDGPVLETGPLRSDLLVDADGLRSRVRRSLGITDRPRSWSPAVTRSTWPGCVRRWGRGSGYWCGEPRSRARRRRRDALSGPVRAVPGRRCGSPRRVGGLVSTSRSPASRWSATSRDRRRRPPTGPRLSGDLWAGHSWAGHSWAGHADRLRARRCAEGARPGRLPGGVRGVPGRVPALGRRPGGGQAPRRAAGLSPGRTWWAEPTGVRPRSRGRSATTAGPTCVRR